MISSEGIVWTEAGSEAEWDLAVRRASDRNIFQSAAWGEYRRRSGWVPRRLIATDRGGRPIMLAQVLHRTFPGGVGLGWVPGGPLFGFDGLTGRRISTALLGLVELLAGEGRGYLRLSPVVPHAPAIDYAFSQVLHRPIFPLNSGFTLRHDLTRTEVEIRKALSAHHRYDIDRALAADIRFEAGRDSGAAREMAGLHDAMRAGKGDADLAPLDAASLLAMQEHLGEHALIYTAYVAGRPACAWLVAVFDDRAFLLNAASGPIGRDVGASYGLAFRLLLQLKEDGIREFDFGGINPRATHAGVNFFKWGFGGEVVQYLGEWEWANSRVLRVMVNLAARRRGDLG